MSLRISEETSKLKKENALKFIWNLPLAPRIDLETSGFPVIEVGPEGAAAIDSNIEVSFNYARANSEGAFLAIFRAAEKLQRRIKVRLMFESTGTTKETEAIKLIQCLANNVTFTREAWIVHLRTLQELPRVADDTPQVPLASFFPGDPDLVKRVSACEPRSLDDKLLDSHARVMASLKNTKSSSIFVDGQRLSEFDPRGTDGILEALLASRLQGQRQ